MKSLVFLVMLFTFCENAKLPSNFQKCNRNQPDLKECLLKAAQNGISQLYQPYDKVNIPNLHPFEISEVTVGQGTGTVAVQQNFKNCKFFGFYEAKLDLFDLDFDEKSLKIVGVIPNITMNCDYELDGKVLLLPIKGTGDSTINLLNLYFDTSFKFEEQKKNSKTYIKILSNDLKMKPGQIKFNFENLFNGDKRLGDNMIQVLNDNWKEVYDDVECSYVEIVSTILKSLFTNFFAKVSIEEALD